MLNTASLKMIDEKFLNDPVKKGFDGEQRTVFLNAVLKHHATVEAVGGDEEKILKDRNASDEGKRKSLAALATKSLDAFHFLLVLQQRAAAAKAQLSTLLYGPLTQKPDGNEVVNFLSDQEIRQSIGKDEVNSAYLVAVNKDQLDVTRALLTAPGGSWVSEDIRARGEQSFALRVNPDAVARLHAVEHLQDHLAALADSTARWLVGMGADEKKVTTVLKEAA